ncbi:MAG: SH3 domain-containing protein [Anaerolineae bacterium]|nr:SH3 domain-containing protein [Thermoflexales bacterium]MDW8407607.1 SH3 domain-containing protein [Anaerolineae bacterium]
MNSQLRFTKRLRTGLIAGLGFAALVLGACSGGAAPPTEIRITAPTPGTSISVGQGTVIQGEAIGEGIVRVEVIIDGLPYATLTTPDNQGVSNFPVQVPWTPMAAGSHAIQLKAYGAEDRLLGQSDPLVIEAKAAIVPTEPVPTATQPPPPAQQPTPAPAAGGGQPAQPQPAATQPPQQEAPSLVVTNDFVNVREGPNTAYRLLGRLNQNETAPVRGKSADGRWWQITYAAGPGGVGWVFGEYVRANAAAAGVPVAAAPPLPTQPPAPQPPPAPVLPTPLPPTAPPVVVPTVAPASCSGPLCVNTTSIQAGGTVRASWNVQNVDGVWFDRGDGSGYQGVPGQWSIDVTNILSNRTLRLRVKQKDGNQPEYAIQINVTGTPGLSGWNPRFKAGTTAWDSPDTCTEVSGAGGSCTYFWTGLDGAQGIWLMVEARNVACSPAASVNVEPAGAANNWLPVSGPSGSITIKFNSTGGHAIRLRARRDNNDWFWLDEKPMKVQPCNAPPAPTNTPVATETPTATPAP